MSRRRLWEALAGLLLLLLALAAALLSRGVADAAAQFRHQQAAWEQGLAPHDPAATGIQGRIGAYLLGIDARSRVQAAYVDYRRDVWYAGGTVVRQTEARSDAIDRIDALRGSLGAADRSRVDVTLCTLFEVNAGTAGNQRRFLLTSAIRYCRAAVTADVTNAEAKLDLELLLSEAKKAQGASGRSSNSGGRRPKSPQERPAATPHTQTERRIGY